MKKLNKKGFTLAELLIVVAIIAVLVAIAVPLFVGSLNNAEQGVKDANIRAVRGLAIGSIMSDSANYHPNVAGNTWYATAEVNNKGTVSKLTIYEDTTATEGGSAASTAGKTAYDKAKSDAKITEENADFCVEKDGTYTVWVVITDADKVSAIPGK